MYGSLVVPKRPVLLALQPFGKGFLPFLRFLAAYDLEVHLPEVLLHSLGYGDGTALVMDACIRQGGFENNLVSFDLADDALSDRTRTGKDITGIVVVEFPSCPLFIEEGFTLEILVEHLRSFYPHIVDGVSDVLL